MSSENNNPINLDPDLEVDVREIVDIVIKKKFIIFLSTLIIAISSALYSLSLPNIYTSEALLMPSRNDISPNIRTYSSLANIAGIRVPESDNANLDIEGIARIKSFDFFKEHFLPYINLQDLIAVKYFDSKNNKAVYDTDIFDTESSTWTEEGKEIKSEFTEQDAYEKYKGILYVYQDTRTRFIEISIDHRSPFIAKSWLDIIIKNINLSMREENAKTASEFTEFLKNLSAQNNPKGIEDAISKLIETQLQKLMLSSADKNYVFKTIDSPVAPEIKSSPRRSIIVILTTLLGSILSISWVLFDHYKRKS